MRYYLLLLIIQVIIDASVRDVEVCIILCMVREGCVARVYCSYVIRVLVRINRKLSCGELYIIVVYN